MRVQAHAVLPTRAHTLDAGLDLYTLSEVTLAPGEGALVETGIAIALPPGTVGLIHDRSSLGKKGLKTFGGVIDAGYRGEIKILIRNLSQDAHTLQRGDRCAQLIIYPILTPQPLEVQALPESSRASAGFGSTGR
jgi:dUTP pyrophosphatase